ncbi:uncharacterized protein LOC117181118 [Belonocnema kinseyi]|uniref:uncharacterized protein LOC117181118 n=1 Tax=Belonocnema kinseyi TaxID=2817044 RepID=UPI00143DA6FB|nr:uncharacterized protein LOC117181118 [Belonocnema kinseyi]
MIQQLNDCAIITVDSRRAQISAVVLTPGRETMHAVSEYDTGTVVGVSKYHELLTKYTDLTRPPVFQKDGIKHRVQHHIKTTPVPPVHAEFRRIAADRLKQVKAEFYIMLQQGIIRLSKSPWSTPLHIVPKKEGSPRLCGDYRALNARAIPDRYTPPHIEDFAQHLHSKKVFSKIDLVRAFNQIPIVPKDIEKAAIVTPFGLFEPCIVTYGLRNAAETCQRFVDEMLRGLDFVYAFVPHEADILHPLNELVVGSKKGKEPVNWTEEAREAFRNSKRALANATLLAHPVPGAPISIVVDASDFAMGDVLQQRVDNAWQPLAFHTKSLTSNQRKYNIRHIKGSENCVVDALSRVEAIALSVDHDSLAFAQKDDAELRELLSSGQSALKFRKVYFPDQNVHLYCDITNDLVRPFVTVSLRRAVFNSLHSLSHPGMRATQHLVTSRFVWPAINKNCKEWTRACTSCQRCEVTRHVSAPVHQFEELANRF